MGLGHIYQMAYVRRTCSVEELRIHGRCRAMPVKPYDIMAMASSPWKQWPIWTAHSPFCLHQLQLQSYLLLDQIIFGFIMNVVGAWCCCACNCCCCYVLFCALECLLFCIGRRANPIVYSFIIRTHFNSTPSGRNFQPDGIHVIIVCKRTSYMSNHSFGRTMESTSGRIIDRERPCIHSIHTQQCCPMCRM